MALLCLMVLWFGHEIGLHGKVPFFRDLGPYFYPMRFSLAESLRAGELPLWDRHMAGGFPLLANFQSATFYLPHLVFLLLPFFPAISALFLFHYLVAATGSYGLCRHWGYPPYLAVVGGILFTLGGIVVSLTNLLNHFQAAVWLPWTVLLAEMCLRTTCWRHFLYFTLVLVVQCLAGSPEIYAMSMVLVILAALNLKARNPAIGSYGKIMLVLLGGNALVVALAMIQFAPTVELLLLSRRAEPIPYAEAIEWSLKPSNLFNLYFLDKEVDTTILPGMRLFFMSRASFFVSYYLGAISLFGTCFWTLCSSAREKFFTLALLTVTLLVALGGYTPVYPLFLYLCPFFGVVRFPEKFFFLTFGILWFVTLRGLFTVFETKALQQKRVLTVLILILLVLLFLYGLLLSGAGILPQFMTPPTNWRFSFDAMAAMAASLIVAVERQLLLGLGLVIMVFTLRKKITHPTVFRFLLIGLVFADLHSAHRQYQYLLDPSFVYKNSTVLSRPGSGSYRVFYYPSGKTAHPAEYAVMAQPSFKEAISLVFSNLLPNSGVFHGFDYFQEIDALSRRPYLTFLTFVDRADPATKFRLLGRLNVKYIISFRSLALDGVELVQHFPEYPSWVYKIDQSIPRVYAVSKTKAETNPTRILEQLSSPEFDPLKEVFLDEPLPLASKEDLFQAETEILNYSNSRVIIRASLDSPGVVVLADSYYPGWKVFVDGTEDKILRANYFFRAVSLSAGKHTVEFRYEPLSFTIGLVISVATLVVLIMVCVTLALRDRKKNSLSGDS